MAEKYIEWLLLADKWRIFFDRRSAEEYKRQAKAEGKRAEIAEEKRNFTVFIFNK